MIQANELRIGNIISSTTHNVLNAILEGITPNGLVLLKGVSTYDTLDKIEPIPLTPEILEKCGFKDCENAIHDFCWFKIEEDGVDLICDHVGVNKTPIKYLHQLQNLYFALTNIELEINL